jgi:hypothetical protein
MAGGVGRSSPCKCRCARLAEDTYLQGGGAGGWRATLRCSSSHGSGAGGSSAGRA